jgi:hypothetical protein
VTVKTRYRVVAYELDAGAETLVMDSSGDGFIAATGTIVHTGRMTSKSAARPQTHPRTPRRPHHRGDRLTDPASER